MTVESELMEPRLRGLRWTTTKRVVDYRLIREDDLSTPQRDRTMLLDNSQDGPRFAVATGEHKIHVSSFSPVDGRFTKGYDLVGPAINEANIVRFDDLERWTWRETRPGDYPEIQQGQTEVPIQQDHVQI